MAPTTIRKAIGAVKDQTSIGIAKVASNMAPELEVAVVKATGHDNDPASEKYIREILHLTSTSHGFVTACVVTVSKRLGKTHDWIVALKCLMLIHRLLNEGEPVFQQEIMYATRRGTRLLNLSDFRDDAHSNSWDHSAFVRTYGLYLDQKLELMAFERKMGGNGGEIERFKGGTEDRFSNNYQSPPRSSRDDGYGHYYRSPPRSSRDERYGDYRSPPRSYHGNNDYEYNRDGESSYGMPPKSRSYGDVRETKEEKKENITPLREMSLERLFGKMTHLQRVFDRFLACRPMGLAKNERMILVALYPIVKESYKLYDDVCEVLAVLLDKFFDMEYQDCVKAFDAYASAAKQIDELLGFYNWCRDIGVARSSEYPQVHKIDNKVLETLEEFLRDRSKSRNGPEQKTEKVPQEEEPANEIKALPPPENETPPPPPSAPEPEPQPPKPTTTVQPTNDLVDLRDKGSSADDQGNQLALALFAEPVSNNSNGAWEDFSSKADWEVALVESASNLSNQKATMGGGLDPLLLNGMYDQGTVNQHMNTTQLTGGSASSVALPGPSKTPVLALPAPDGTVQPVGHDPFAASLSIPPPSYVQMADIEKKQHMLVQEQNVWQQYAREGMQGQTSLNKLGGAGVPYYGQPGMMNNYGMPNGSGFPQPGYYYNAPL